MTDTATTPFQDTLAPLSVPPTHRPVENEGTLYAPTRLSWEAGLFLEDACPMSYDIEDTQTWIVLGDTNSALNLQLTDRALVNLATLTNAAAQAMLHDRSQRISHSTSGLA